MSSAALADSDLGVLAAWETKGRVSFSRVDPRRARSRRRLAPGRRGDRKHPAVAGNARGEAILVWTEGTGWQKGARWPGRSSTGPARPLGPSGRIENGVPVWGLATVVARPDGGFTIITSRSRAPGPRADSR